VRQLDFIEAIEDCLGIKAQRNYMDMHKGDVPATWANAVLPQTLTGYQPQPHFRVGIDRFVEWYRDYDGK
jgi:UDP-glucuronate 4-epimerase